jgi:hypothetical protein
MRRAANGQAARHRHTPLPSLSNKRRCARTTGPAEATLPASVTKQVGTYNHYLGVPHWAFGWNHRELWQRSAHPQQVRHIGTGSHSNVFAVSTAPDQSVRIPAGGRPSSLARGSRAWAPTRYGGGRGGEQARDLARSAPRRALGQRSGSGLRRLPGRRQRPYPHGDRARGGSQFSALLFRRCTGLGRASHDLGGAFPWLTGVRYVNSTEPLHGLAASVT